VLDLNIIQDGLVLDRGGVVEVPEVSRTTTHSKNLTNRYMTAMSRSVPRRWENKHPSNTFRTDPDIVSPMPYLCPTLFARIF